MPSSLLKKRLPREAEGLPACGEAASFEAKVHGIPGVKRGALGKVQPACRRLKRNDQETGSSTWIAETVVLRSRALASFNWPPGSRK